MSKKWWMEALPSLGAPVKHTIEPDIFEEASEPRSLRSRIERELEHGTRLAELNEEIRELRQHLHMVDVQNADLRQQLKVMAEDRDEYRDNWEYSGTVARAMADATEDERAMVATYVAKLMGEGRREYGPLDLMMDDRDLLGEAEDELDDVMSYAMMAKRRLWLLRGRV